MRHYRQERVGALIQKELGKILLREVETPGELLTVTAVEVDKKLERAIVYISVFASDGKDTEQRVRVAMDALESQKKHFQSLLYKRLNIRPMPYIVFKYDRGVENAAKVERALIKDNS
jgi:ribosome-binding factor A